jgi:hypothetical protein
MVVISVTEEYLKQGEIVLDPVNGSTILRKAANCFPVNMA